MKKNIFCLFAIILFVGTHLFSQTTEHYSVSQDGYDKINLTFYSGNLETEEFALSGERYTRVSMDGYFNATQIGNPALPVMVKMIEIPLCDSILVSYTLSNPINTQISTTAPIYPAQPSYPKSYKGEREFVKNNNTYKSNQFYGEKPVVVKKTGVMRNMNLATIYISPVQYNPVSGEVVIYSRIDVEITFLNADITATEQMKKLHSNAFFSPENAPVINPIPLREKDEIASAPIKYLIVSHSSFRGQLDEFIAWKKRKGYLVEVGYTDETAVGGSYTNIQAYIKSKYTGATSENPAPTYVLLVGDVAQIPAKTVTSGSGWFSSSHPSDLYYFTWTAGDNIPDCYYGRFSANSISELTPQIEKTLMYEKYTMSDPSYLDKAVLIAGTDSYWSQTHADGQVNYIATNYMNQAYGYSNIYKYNYNCSSQAATIRTQIGQGAGWVNYTAHGDVTEWSDPAFTASQISAMQNEGKYGVMIGSCCLSNKFDETSFGESLVRANKKGALAYIGASNSTYWDEDVYWAVGVRSNITANMGYDASNLGVYDRLFHINGEPYASYFVSLGQILMSGNLSVESSSSEDKTYYWEIYHLMGDPSVMPWLTQPETMNVTHSAVQPGMTSIQVNAVPYAYIALTDNLELIAAAFADNNGQVTFSFPALNDLSQVELAVSAQNYRTYFKSLGNGASEIQNYELVVTVLPNPANNQVTVSSDNILKTIEIYDVTGKIVQQVFPESQQTISINLKDLRSGIYFMKLMDQNNQMTVKKIIKN